MAVTEENIISTEYSEIMQKSYIDYAMSVIISRALPDIRDGLKPVQRRTLYDMGELGIRHDSPYRKCARIVGDTMGKYHPHGDSSIYEALVVLAQDFKKGRKLVDGHGNFGSIEGDGAAAMRYTEARLEKLTEEAFLKDLDKDTVNFLPNFDETEKEPEVLPVLFPNFLVNGSEGIAVGMATSTPPHNLSEVIEAEKAYLKNPEISLEKLMELLPGPDFPTGGIVTNRDELKEIYETGTGKIKLRGKVEIEKAGGGRVNLVITEIPYTMIGSGIMKFMSDAAGLVESRKTNDITDISNQSSKEGIRIVIELKRGADPDNIINMLYKKTKLEDTFGVNMLSVCAGRPETLGLKGVLSAHVGFLYEINTRKYTKLLAVENDRKEVQEGLIRAADVIDLIIEILRGSKSRKDAMACLVHGETDNIRFRSVPSRENAALLLFTEKQANAILDMRLSRLIGLELDALNKEYEETLKKIERYEDILSNRDSMKKAMIRDLDAIKKEFGTERRTRIENAEEAVFIEKPVEEAEVVFLMDRFGYAKIIDLSTYERNREAAEAEMKVIFTMMNTDKVCIFTADGKLHTFKGTDLPVSKFRDKGTPVDNVSNYDSAREFPVYVAPMSTVTSSRLLFVTKHAMCKVVSGTEFDILKRSIAASGLNDGDELLSITPLEDSMRQILLRTIQGVFLRFNLEEIPEKKKNAVGVRGMKLSEKDALEEVYFMNFADERTIEYRGTQMPMTYVKTTHRDMKGTKVRI
ncbi:MAG: DNA topoisomerase 4 subunit A [Lachnospiraceae bacterium]|nr:DNA topoisomerase 4 subunit A [Lachnospiraceae bacterium]